MADNLRDPGGYDVRITIEKNTPAADPSGQKLPSWGEDFKRWGKVETQGGGERHANHKLTADATHLVFFPSDSKTRTITPKHRLTLKGKTFAVLTAYDMDLENREVVLQCKEVL